MSNEFSLCLDKSQCNFHTGGQFKQKKNREKSKTFFKRKENGLKQLLILKNKLLIACCV